MPESNVSIVIFGASGDLTRRKLLPALFDLHRKRRLSESARVVGFARREYDDEQFRELMKRAVEEANGEAPDPGAWAGFARRLFYVTGDVEEPAHFRALDERLRVLEGGPAGRLYYLAVSPDLYPNLVAHLGSCGMAREDGGFRRIVIEKPFGRDRESARALNQGLLSVFQEDQIYRIDHYLGKETAQNILFSRFANTIWEPIWNRNYVESVQVSVLESVDVGHRAAFYDDVGVLRDMFQNHLLQLLTLVAMEPAGWLGADAIRNEKMKVLCAIPPIPEERIPLDTVRGQYRGYREAKGVAPGSTTATYGAMKLTIENWRWHGVPFYLRSGKALAEKVTEIVIQFRTPPPLLFPHSRGSKPPENHLAICVEPDEGMHLRFEAKVPDTDAELRPVDMEFHYADDFQGIPIPRAYERLLLDALHGDPSLFARSDAIDLAWKIMDPSIQAWETGNAPPLEIYEPGSAGPKSAGRLLERDERSWVRGCGGHALPSAGFGSSKTRVV
ncbi:MAG: glucose-6-phosphate dehydrogenase [Vicinamibacteria bacterium]